jgi:hypothetical protein
MQNASLRSHDCHPGVLQEERRGRVGRVCGSLGPGHPADLANWHFLESTRPVLALCATKKAGSTSVHSRIMDSVDCEDCRWLQDRTTTGGLALLEAPGTLRALVTSHPLERLAATYIHLFHTGLQQEAMFPCWSRRPDGSCRLTTNTELAGRIGHAQGGSTRYLIPDTRYRIPDTRHQATEYIISFPEFIAYILDTRGQFAARHRAAALDFPGLAAHWEPVSSYCSPCRHPPAVVLELATLTLELPRLLEESGLAALYPPFPPLRTTNSNMARWHPTQSGTDFILTRTIIFDSGHVTIWAYTFPFQEHQHCPEAFRPVIQGPN